MNDYAEWGEATAGIVADEAEEVYEGYLHQLQQRTERDAVLCLVDCSQAMFDVVPPAEAGVMNSIAPDVASSLHDYATPFSMSMQCIRSLMEEKLLTRQSDVVAIVFYRTASNHNSIGYRGTCVLQEASLLSKDSIQKVAQLEDSGVKGSVAYHSFLQQYGHWPEEQQFKFSETLWIAQQILLSSCNAASIQHRRIFVFTDDDDPTRGDSIELERCQNRVWDLAREGVVLEVFGFDKVRPGSGVVDDDTRYQGSNIPLQQVPADPLAVSESKGLLPFSATDGASAPITVVSGSQNEPGASTSRSATGFSEEKFWARLVDKNALRQARREPAKDYDATSTLPPPLPPGDYRGAVYVSGGPDVLTALLNQVQQKKHPQRPFHQLLLRIGGELSHTTPVPQMAVALYAPLVPGVLPKRQWLDKRTGRAVRRVTCLQACHPCPSSTCQPVMDGLPRHQGNGMYKGENAPNVLAATVTKKTEGSCVAAVRPVSKEGVHYFTEVGGQRLYFTSEERKHLVAVASAEAELGLTILCFKHLDDLHLPMHMIKRSSFVHVNLQRGGQKSHRLFVLLVRRLRRQKKAAVAQYVPRLSTTVPRLVALVPSVGVEWMQHDTWDQLPTEGIGLYMVPLPYAEEIRPVPCLDSCTLVDRHRTPYLDEGSETADGEDGAVALRHELAVSLVEALTVPYRIDAVHNPSLQKQYRMLQSMAHQYFSIDGSDFGSGAFATLSLDASSSMPVAVETEDDTVPDYDGMKNFASLFHAFNRNVLGSTYDSSIYCGGAYRSTGDGSQCHCTSIETSSGKRLQSTHTENASDAEARRLLTEIMQKAAQSKAWGCVTVRQLQDYMKAIQRSTGGARRKEDLIARVQLTLLNPTSQVEDEQ